MRGERCSLKRQEGWGRFQIWESCFPLCVAAVVILQPKPECKCWFSCAWKQENMEQNEILFPLSGIAKLTWESQDFYSQCWGKKSLQPWGVCSQFQRSCGFSHCSERFCSPSSLGICAVFPGLQGSPRWPQPCSLHSEASGHKNQSKLSPGVSFYWVTRAKGCQRMPLSGRWCARE